MGRPSILKVEVKPTRFEVNDFIILIANTLFGRKKPSLVIMEGISTGLAQSMISLNIGAKPIATKMNRVTELPSSLTEITSNNITLQTTYAHRNG